MKQSITILGVTGSIGTQTLDVCENLNIGVFAMAANRSVKKTEEAVRRFRPRYVAMCDEAAAEDLRVRVADLPVKVLSGMQGVCQIAAESGSDTVVTALTGAAGLLPTLTAIEAKKRIALANKETLVCAGSLVMQAAKAHGAEIIPVDSEHSAIFQSLMGNKKDSVKRIILTASGGPFRGKTREETASVTAADALNHPNWSMGPKVTIDSATMMNKGLEFIEAMHLFAVSPDKIKVLVHPQSIVHSMVEYEDNSVIAQLGAPDMRLPIQLALTYPDRARATANPLDFAKCSSLTFEEPDLEAFPLLALAMRCAPLGDMMCAAMNAANEVAVEAFLNGKIGFNSIYDVVNLAVNSAKTKDEASLDDILGIDAETRSFVRGEIC